MLTLGVEEGNSSESSPEWSVERDGVAFPETSLEMLLSLGA
jgi:hypothetical protein